MKKVLMMFIILMSVLACSNASAKDIEIYMFGKEIVCDVPPVAENGRTLVPVRAISEEGLGAEVEWLGKTQQVAIKKENLEILLTLGDTKVVVNGKEEKLDVPAKAISGRTMVPVRFISETLDYKVDWDSENYRVVIEENSKNYIKKIDVEKTNNDNLLNIKLSSYSEPKISVFEGPYRIVMDFEKTTFEGHDDKLNVGSGFIKQVRWAGHDDYYRIVVECQGKQPYKLVKTGKDSFSVIIGTPSTKVDITKENEEPPDKDTDKSDSGTAKDEPDDKKNNEDDEDDEEDEEDKIPPHEKETLVIIDPGHGGSDPGAVGVDEEGQIIYDEDNEIYLKEKDVNLAVALKVYEYLIDHGVNAVMTRNKDKYVSLRDVADMANNKDATLFVSIHSNSVEGSPQVNGMEVLYYDTDGKSEYGITSKKLADNIRKKIVKNLDMADRGLKERPGLAVLKWTDMPAALVEMGFVSNEDDREKLLDPQCQEDMAYAIAEGILQSIEDVDDYVPPVRKVVDNKDDKDDKEK